MVTARKVIEDAVALLLVGVVFPIALVEIATANMQGVNPAVTVIFQVLLPVLAIIGVALYFIPSGKGKRGD